MTSGEHDWQEVRGPPSVLLNVPGEGGCPFAQEAPALPVRAGVSEWHGLGPPRVRSAGAVLAPVSCGWRFLMRHSVRHCSPLRDEEVDTAGHRGPPAWIMSVQQRPTYASPLSVSAAPLPRWSLVGTPVSRCPILHGGP